MGQRGPVPNRSDDLARPRERKGGDNTAVTKGSSRPATIPQANEGWHPIALMLWNSTLESGQTDFYESSDYAFLYSVCEDLSYYKNAPNGKRSGQMLVAIYGAFERLLLTEGDRRRVRLELQGEDTGPDEAVAQVMGDYEKRLHLVS